MKDATNDNDTWTALGLAAARVLTQIEQTEDPVTSEQKRRDCEEGAPNDDNQGADHAGVVFNKKRSA